MALHPYFHQHSPTLGDPEAQAAHMRYVIPPASSGSPSVVHVEVYDFHYFNVHLKASHTITIKFTITEYEMSRAYKTVNQRKVCGQDDVLGNTS